MICIRDKVKEVVRMSADDGALLECEVIHL